MAEQQGLIEGFKNFILRGNVVDLAVAVVIGMAFNAIVKALVADVITPLIGAIFGQKGAFSGAFIVHLNGSAFLFGDLISNVITFFSIAAVVYFLIVRPLNTLMKRFASGEESVSAPDPQLTLLKEIRDLLAADRV